MGEKKKEEKLEDALLKVALGFQVAEVTEEFAEVDGELKLTKRKRVKKDVPPDLKAVQILLGENGGQGIEELSDEELEKEKERLLSALKEVQKDKEKETGQVRDETLSVAKKAVKCQEAETKAAVVKKTRPKPRKRVIRQKKED